MKDKIRSYIETGNTIYGVEQTQHDERDMFYCLGLKKAKNNLDKITEITFKNPKDLAKHIGKDKPIALIINSKDVLTKKVNGTIKDDLKILNEAFPNLDVNGFYYQVLKQETSAFVSICRKDVIDTILTNFENWKLNIVDFFLGNLTLAHSLSFTENSGYITTNNHRITLVNNEIGGLEKLVNPTTETYDINGIDISSKFLLSFSGALRLALGTDILLGNLNQKHLELKESFKQKRIFKLSSRIVIAFLLAALTINFLFFNYYFNKVNELRSTSDIASSSQKKMTDLASKVLKSKKKVEDIHRISNSRVSLYINSIVSSIPNTITLNELDYQPIKRRIQLGKPIESELQTIKVVGESTNSELFSSWLTQLEKLNWVKIVDIVNYETLNNSVSTFNISIKVDE